MTIIFIAFGAVLALALWIPATSSSGSDAAIFAFAALYGLPLGCFAAAVPLLVAQISDMREIGVRVGATFFLNGFAGLTGNPIAGALIGHGGVRGGGEYTYLKVFCGLAIAIGGCFLTAARVCQNGGFRLLAKI